MTGRVALVTAAAAAGLYLMYRAWKDRGGTFWGRGGAVLRFTGDYKLGIGRGDSNDELGIERGDEDDDRDLLLEAQGPRPVISYLVDVDPGEETDAGPAAPAGPNITKYGKPSPVIEIKKPGYSILYNCLTKTPLYVVERLTPGKVKGEAAEREGVNFYRESDLGSKTCASNSDYTNSGFDRGHMAAAGNHVISERALTDTFSFCNVAPQFPSCNRGNWKVLENYARACAAGDVTVYVYSGPLYIPQHVLDGTERYVVYRVIGGSSVAVPTHFFKILVIEKPKCAVRVECYLVENSPDVGHVPVMDMKVELKDIESWSGLSFDRLHRFS